MPDIGDIKQSKEIGLKGSSKRIWYACIDCGKERWVGLKNGKPQNPKCHACAYLSMRGKNHPMWTGGRRKKLAGYIEIRLQPDDPFCSMINCGGYVQEHRLIMAKYLGRCLLKTEQVHHINGIRNDNRIENLEILNKGSHTLRTMFCQNCELKKEIRLLRFQVTELQKQLQGNLI